jgi:hypothetical protein
LGYILGVFIIKRIWSPRRQSRYQSFFRGVWCLPHNSDIHGKL